jgi:hypothetical protein
MQAGRPSGELGASLETGKESLSEHESVHHHHHHHHHELFFQEKKIILATLIQQLCICRYSQMGNGDGFCCPPLMTNGKPQAQNN